MKDSIAVMNKLVTIYIPTCNRQKLLERAVQSALNQTYNAIEVIVVDDCSTDETQSFLKQLNSTDKRVSSIFQRVRTGAPAARNAAIRASKGVFVTGLDDDDYFAPDRIELFVSSWNSFIRKGITPSGLYSQSNEIRGPHSIVSKRPMQVQYADLFRQNEIGNQIFAPREHYEDIGMFDEDMPAWQDLDLFLRMLRTFGPAKLVNAPSYIYDDEDRSDRISGKATRVRAASRAIAAKHAVDFPEATVLLQLQMLNGYYSITPSFAEVTTILKSKHRVEGLRRIARTIVKERLLRMRRFNNIGGA